MKARKTTCLLDALVMLSAVLLASGCGLEKKQEASSLVTRKSTKAPPGLLKRVRGRATELLNGRTGGRFTLADYKEIVLYDTRSGRWLFRYIHRNPAGTMFPWYFEVYPDGKGGLAVREGCPETAGTGKKQAE